MAPQQRCESGFQPGYAGDGVRRRHRDDEPVLEAVDAAGQEVTAKASVSDNTLRVSVAGLSVPALKIPTLPLLPCVADAVILAGRIRLTCQVDHVPPELVGRPLNQLSRP